MSFIAFLPSDSYICAAYLELINIPVGMLNPTDGKNEGTYVQYISGGVEGTTPTCDLGTDHDLSIYSTVRDGC